MQQKTKVILLFIALLAVCLSTYCNSLFNDFVFDDVSLVVDNPSIKSSKYIGQALKKDLWDMAYEGNKPNYYRPVQAISFMLDYKIWRLNPFGFHLTNIILHCMNAFLVFMILYLVFGSFFISTVASLIFALHPISVTAVTYISGRADLLCALFMLCAFLFSLLFLKSEKKKIFFAALTISTVLALFSRENAPLIPLGILLLYLTAGGKKERGAFLFISTALIASLYLCFRLLILKMPFPSQPHFLLNPGFRAVNFLYVILSYIFLLLAPHNLYLMHTVDPILAVTDIRLWITLCASMLFLIIWWAKRKDKILNFGAVWFLIFILPVFYGMVGFGRKLSMFEHWAYISSVGFYLILGYLFFLLKKNIKAGVYPLIAVIFLTYASITVATNLTFKDRISLASCMLKYYPDNKEAHKELADVYLRKKDYSQALLHLNKAMKIEPVDPDLYMLQGVYYEDNGKMDLAMASYEKLLKLEPASARANNNIGALYYDLGEASKAQTYFKRAMVLNPLLPEPYLNMAKMSLKNDRINEAIYFYKKALLLNPASTEAMLNIGIFYANNNQLDKAIEIWQKALKLDPGNKNLKENIEKAKAFLRSPGD